MRKYETIFISDPDLQDQARADLFDKLRNIIARENGILLDFDEWGNKKLAYEIRKKSRGHYVCITYGGTGELVKELERNMRLSDDVMKFMTILLTDDVTAEQLENELRQTQQESEPESSQEEVPADTEDIPADSTEEDSKAEDSDAEEPETQTSQETE
jgi:small subunit ribosomal protein S6